jgi:hypothetical protein
VLLAGSLSGSRDEGEQQQLGLAYWHVRHHLGLSIKATSLCALGITVLLSLLGYNTVSYLPPQGLGAGEAPTDTPLLMAILRRAQGAPPPPAAPASPPGG